jgi:hypothetical protein
MLNRGASLGDGRDTRETKIYELRRLTFGPMPIGTQLHINQLIAVWFQKKSQDMNSGAKRRTQEERKRKRLWPGAYGKMWPWTP